MLGSHAVPGSGGARNCTLEPQFPGFNMIGHDMSHSPAINAATCQQRCCAISGCRAWTFTTHQPSTTSNCEQGTACCWLKDIAGAKAVKENCTSGTIEEPPAPHVPHWQPTLTRDVVIAVDPTGNLRDPSAAVQDTSGRWHFWVDYMPGKTQPGWAAYQHHYSAASLRVS